MSAFRNDADFLNHFATLDERDQATLIASDPVIQDPSEPGPAVPLFWTAIDPQNINVDGPISLGENYRAESGWKYEPGGNTIAFSGTPDRVRLNLQLHAQTEEDAESLRTAAVVELYKGRELFASSATGYIRGTNDHEECSYTIAVIDPKPGTDPTYSVVLRRDTTVTIAVTSTVGQFAAEAVL